MAENSGISWTHHTVNPWWGCAKVSPACANCYAEQVDARFHVRTRAQTGNWEGFAAAAEGKGIHWGANAERFLRVGRAAQEAFRYERRAVKEGRRFRVFCASMADFFEDRPDLDQPRLDFLDVIRRTPHLDWLILTKRPEAIQSLLKRAFDMVEVQQHGSEFAVWLYNWLDGFIVPENVALGTTVESQDFAAPRLAALLQVPCRTHFVSVEPMLGPVDLTHLDVEDCSPWCQIDALSGRQTDMGRPCPDSPRLDWVICGGESGIHARSMKSYWPLHIQEACRRAGVPFFFKQQSQADWPTIYNDFDRFPGNLKTRQFPAAFDYL